MTYLACYIPRWYTRPKTVTRPSTNRARRALTSFMRRTPLTTTPRLQQVCVRPRPLAVNVALPAFAVERRAAVTCYRAVSMLLLHCRNWTDRRTPDSCIDSAPHTMRAVPITTDRVSGEGNAIGRVRPSVCFHSRLTLIFCTFVNHDDSSPGIESQGHRSM